MIRPVLSVAAIAALILTLMNASWIAPGARGALLLAAPVALDCRDTPDAAARNQDAVRKAVLAGADVLRVARDCPGVAAVRAGAGGREIVVAPDAMVAAGIACFDRYRRTGWLGIVPDDCPVIVVSVDRQGLAWGWPNRFLARMDRAGVRTIVTGPEGAGLTDPTDLPRVPRAFRGLLWVDAIDTIGPALR